MSKAAMLMSPGLRSPAQGQRLRTPGGEGECTVWCPFSESALAKSRSGFDRMYAIGPGGEILLPAVGMLMPGYFLVTANRHVRSFAHYSSDDLAALFSWISSIVDELSQDFGAYVVAEHGSGSDGCSGACIEHAHYHLIPTGTRVASVLEEELAWRAMRQLSEIRRYCGRSYLYLAHEGRQLVFEGGGVPSQWFRRVVARELGRQDWDWAITRGDSALKETEAVITLRNGRLALSAMGSPHGQLARGGA